MQIDLTPEQETWLKAEIAAGRFTSAEDVIAHAINEAKRASLRNTLMASIAAGGDNSADDARHYVRSRLDARDRKGNGG